MRLTTKEKVAYGLGAVGKDMVYMLSASYILYYYQDILNVSAIAMGIILMAARVFDAFNDPVMGIIVAKTRTRWGKFRPWLLIGTITDAVILYLMFAAPPALETSVGVSTSIKSLPSRNLLISFMICDLFTNVSLTSGFIIKSTYL